MVKTSRTLLSLLVRITRSPLFVWILAERFSTRVALLPRASFCIHRFFWLCKVAPLPVLCTTEANTRISPCAVVVLLRLSMVVAASVISRSARTLLPAGVTISCPLTLRSVCALTLLRVIFPAVVREISRWVEVTLFRLTPTPSSVATRRIFPAYMPPNAFVSTAS
ncbi:Uncharacterised protein [Klebsiella variicola]|nr:Uncharacterised protein [Klebsiella variicola]